MVVEVLLNKFTGHFKLLTFDKKEKMFLRDLIKLDYGL
jgi:hypothetical protein